MDTSPSSVSHHLRALRNAGRIYELHKTGSAGNVPIIFWPRRREFFKNGVRIFRSLAQLQETCPSQHDVLAVWALLTSSETPRLHWIPFSLAIMEARIMWLYEWIAETLKPCVLTGRPPRSYGLADVIKLPKKEAPQDRMSELQRLRLSVFDGPVKDWRPQDARLPRDQESFLQALLALKRIYPIMFGGEESLLLQIMSNGYEVVS